MKKNMKKSKKRIIIITSILLILFIIIGTGAYLLYQYKYGYKDSITIEVGNSLPTINDYLYMDIKLESNIDWGKLELKDNKIYIPGEYIGHFKVDNKEYKVNLIVKDTTPPEIIGAKDYSMLAYNKVPNILEGVSVKDNSLEKIEVDISGEIDTETVGVYPVKLTAKDSSGNEVVKEIKLEVKENKDVTVTKSSNGHTIKNYHGVTYVEDTIIVNKTYSLPNNFVPQNLVAINGYIRVIDFVKEEYDKLVSDSRKLGLRIYASSGYRSYNDQAYIYNNYVRQDGKKEADTYSARAGHSEHQTGLVIDLNTVDYSFEGTKESNWLKDNCYKYGFIIRFPKGKDSITGYMHEPWHIRYVGKKLAEKLYNNGDWITLEEYYGLDSKYKD